MERFAKICLWMVMLLSLLGLSACTNAQPENPTPQPVGETQPVSPAQSASPAPEISQPAPAATSTTSPQIDCAGPDIHPIGQSIANTYEVPYQQVMAWFCSGYSFDNIMIALETSEAVDVPPDTLLKMIVDKEWEEVWAEVGFVAQP